MIDDKNVVKFKEEDVSLVRRLDHVRTLADELTLVLTLGCRGLDESNVERQSALAALNLVWDSIARKTPESFVNGSNLLAGTVHYAAVNHCSSGAQFEPVSMLGGVLRLPDDLKK